MLAVVVLVPDPRSGPAAVRRLHRRGVRPHPGTGVRAYNVLIVVLAAVTVTLAMRTVGLLLVSALMVVPVAAARNLVRGFLAALVCAIVVGVFVSVGGAVGSFYADAAPGAFIVVLAIGVFALSWPVSAAGRAGDVRAARAARAGRRRHRWRCT